jgi:hypothetical protein
MSVVIKTVLFTGSQGMATVTKAVSHLLGMWESTVSSQINLPYFIEEAHNCYGSLEPSADISENVTAVKILKYQALLLVSSLISCKENVLPCILCTFLNFLNNCVRINWALWLYWFIYKAHAIWSLVHSLHVRFQGWGYVKELRELLGVFGTPMSVFWQFIPLVTLNHSSSEGNRLSYLIFVQHWTCYS